jgi:hypothetical protein
MKTMTRKQAHTAMNSTLKTPYSWVGKTPEGKLVLNLWTDNMSRRQSPVIYDGRACHHAGKTVGMPIVDRNGFHELMGYLRELPPDGTAFVVMCRAVDTSTDPRVVADSWPRPDLLLGNFKLFDDGFTAEVIDVMGV